MAVGTRTKRWLVVAAACFPCCLPLLIPLVAAGAGGGAVAFGSVWAGLAAAAIGGVAAGLWWRRRQHARRPQFVRLYEEWPARRAMPNRNS